VVVGGLCISAGVKTMNIFRRFLLLSFFVFVASLPLVPQGTNTTIRLYADINVPPNVPGAYADLQVPQGNWRIVSIMAFATIAGIVTTDIDTTVTSNPEFQLKASESGSVEPLFIGGALRATATKKKILGGALVRVIVTLQQR
jgi:hypothetical protein